MLCAQPQVAPKKKKGSKGGESSYSDPPKKKKSSAGKPKHVRDEGLSDMLQAQGTVNKGGKKKKKAASAPPVPTNLTDNFLSGLGKKPSAKGGQKVDWC